MISPLVNQTKSISIALNIIYSTFVYIYNLSYIFDLHFSAFVMSFKTISLLIPVIYG